VNERLWVLDAAAIIQIEHIVAADRQWDLLEHLTSLVEEGHIALPRQVVAELRQERHHDGPEIWTRSVARRLRHPQDCSLESHLRVVRSVGDR
jgi:hypothetical protein